MEILKIAITRRKKFISILQVFRGKGVGILLAFLLLLPLFLVSLLLLGCLFLLEHFIVHVHVVKVNAEVGMVMS